MADEESTDTDERPPPSDWVVRFSSWVPKGGPVLDLACGAGRHSRFFLQRGDRVTAVDRTLQGIQDILSHPHLESFEIDLEDGRPFPFRGQGFAAVIVTNYLYRPILKDLVSVVSEGGILIYETFARGNERFRGPSRPDFLLKPGELLEAVRGQLRVVAYEDRIICDPGAAAIQRIAAIRQST
jgi:SAM-dependent methyltransferase